MPASEIGIKDVLIKIHKTAIGFPTVPKGLARIRVMVSAMLSREDLDYGLEKFAQVGRELGVI